MELNQLKIPVGSRKNSKRIGRGNASGSGTTAGRGTKGQKSRSGGKMRRGFEGGQMPLYRRIPKRGFKNINRKEYACINVAELDKRFEAGGNVSPDLLKERRIIKIQMDGIKILGQGEITKALHVKAHRFSKSAAEKIKAAGGSVEELS